MKIKDLGKAIGDLGKAIGEFDLNDIPSFISNLFFGILSIFVRLVMSILLGVSSMIVKLWYIYMPIAIWVMFDERALIWNDFEYEGWNQTYISFGLLRVGEYGFITFGIIAALYVIAYKLRNKLSNA